MERLPVADQLLLAAINEDTGEPLLHRAALAFGLAGGLLAEQVLAGRVGLAGGALFAYDAEAPTDAVGATIWSELSRPPTRSATRDVRVWLRWLSTTAVTEVGRRLVGSRMVRVAERRRALRRPVTVFVPTEPGRAAVAAHRAVFALARHEPMDSRDRTVVGLMRVTGLVDHVDWVFEATPRRLRELSTATEQALPAELRALLSHVESAIGAATMTRR